MGQARFAVAFLALGAFPAITGGHAFAANCIVSLSNAPLSASDVSNLLTGRYACIGTSPSATWNELHNGTQVLDYKKGPADPTDPSDTPAHPTGTYTVIGSATGTVTYNYGAGGTYGFNILANQSGTNPFSSSGGYSFCTTTGGTNLDVTISAAHC